MNQPKFSLMNLVREYTDISAQRYKPEEWKVRIDGIEAFPEYATPTYEYIYSNIYYGDASRLLSDLPDYDLVIIGDVIEHFSKEAGLELLNNLKQKCKYILLSSPTFFFEQSIFNNPFENHISFWNIDDFKEFIFDYEEYEQSVFVALLQGNKVINEPLRLKPKASKLVYKTKLLKHHPKLAVIAKSVLKKLTDNH